MIGRLALAVAALVLSPAVSAQDAGKPIDEVATTLAYGFCPLFVDAGFSLESNAALSSMGFEGKPEAGKDERFGDIETLTAKRTDGGLTFGGKLGKFCSVVVTGPQRIAALAKLRAMMPRMGLDLKSQGTRDLGEMKLETFKGPFGDKFLTVLLLDANAAQSPATVAQLIVTTE